MENNHVLVVMLKPGFSSQSILGGDYSILPNTVREMLLINARWGGRASLFAGVVSEYRCPPSLSISIKLCSPLTVKN